MKQRLILLAAMTMALTGCAGTPATVTPGVTYAPPAQIVAQNAWDTACQTWNLAKSEAALAVVQGAIKPGTFTGIKLSEAAIDPFCTTVPTNPTVVAQQVQQAAMGIFAQLPAAYQQGATK